ncbi:hypothetical protein LG291_22545 [Cytobacillus firmus]|uniref:hypothetical protein n=1 Tax=Cytobacillus firmus TaxID=1399 RepID=UPI00384A570F
MIYQVQLLKGLLHPNNFLYQLEKAEEVRNYRIRIFFLFVISLFIFTISSYLGIGTEIISRELTSVSPSEFEARKLLFLLGQILWGLIYPAIMLFIPAAFFWALTDIPFIKVLVIQMFALAILLFEKALLIPFNWKIGLDESSSPFSLGPIAQYLTDSTILIYFLGQVSVFSLLVLYIQYKGLKYLTDKSRGQIISYVLLINVLFWLVSSFLSFIKFEKLL